MHQFFFSIFIEKKSSRLMQPFLNTYRLPQKRLLCSLVRTTWISDTVWIVEYAPLEQACMISSKKIAYLSIIFASRGTFKPQKWLWPFIILLLVFHVSPPSTGKLWRPLSTEEVTSFSSVLAAFACKHGPPSNWCTRLTLRLKDRIWCVNITC